MGNTIGEETIFLSKEPVVRAESCICITPEGGALLRVSLEELIKMGSSRQLRITRGTSMVKDFRILMRIL